MTYKKSLARRSFEAVLRDLRKTSQHVSFKSRRLPDGVRQMVFRSAIFQASAAFEAYLKEVLEDWIDMCGKEDLSISAMPRELIAFSASRQAHSTWRRFLASGNEGGFIKELVGNRLVPRHYDRTAKVSEIINSKICVYDKKYPSIRNIKALLFRFGVPNVFQELNKRGKRDLEKSVQSFMDIRTEIAHENPPRNLAFEDIKIHLDHIALAVKFMDRFLHSHLSRLAGSSCWRTL